MNIGDVVIPIGDVVLACGCGRYDCAIVASIEPFALVSVQGDMLWTCTVKPTDVIPLCQASESIIQRAVNRFEKHIAKKIDA